MSEASKTNDLAGELRERALIGADVDPIDAARLLNEAADALEAATRVPVQGEPNDDREALRDEFRSYLGDEIYVCSRDHSAWSHGTMGLDDFSLAADDDEIVDSLVSIASRATVPDAATDELETLRDIAETHAFCADRLSIETERADRVAREVCDRGCSYTGGPDEECSAHGRTPRDLWEQVEKVAAERDAALAAVERVRLVVDNHRSVEQHNEMVPISDIADLIREPSSADYLAALDGAPEPERTWEYALGGVNSDGRVWCDDEDETTSDPDEAREWAKDAREGGTFSNAIAVKRRFNPWLPVEGESK